MNAYIYLDTQAHGDAWRYFTEWARRASIAVPGQYSADVWPIFLAGWKAKGKQHGDLRGRK